MKDVGPQMVNGAARLLAHLFAEAGVDPAAAADFATLLISATEGAVIMSRARRSREPFDRTARLPAAEARRIASA